MSGKKIFLVTIVIAVFTLVELHAQPGSSNIRGRLYYQGTPHLTMTTGRLGSSSIRTDSNGEFRVEVAADEDLLKLVLNGDWKILFPTDGYIPVTKDPDFIWEIHIGKANEGASTYNKIFKKIGELQGANALQADQLKSLLQSEFAGQKEVLDQLNEKYFTNLNQQLALYEKIRLENEKKAALLDREKSEGLRKGKKQTLDLFTADIDHFTSRALDLRDAFKNKGSNVYYNNKVLKEIGEKISSYSESYEALNKNRKKIINGVEEYWEDQFRVIDARELVDYALEDLHKQTMLTTNLLINDINEFNLGKTKNRKRKKQELQNDIDRFVLELGYKLDTLKEKKERIFQKLGDG